MNRAIRLAAVTLATVFSCSCLGQQKDPWEPLHLESVKLDGATLYYEKSLASQVDFVRVSYKKFLSEQAESKKPSEDVEKKWPDITRDVARILGVPAASLGKVWKELFYLFLNMKVRLGDAQGRFRLYLVTRETTKDYLRKGGSLPNFTYDKATDTAKYGLFTRVSKSVSEKQSEDFTSAPPLIIEELALPVSGGDAVEGEIQQIFSAFSTLVGMGRRLGGMTRGVLIHELAEGTILFHRLRPYDPYFRWFSDGFANAIAIHLLRKHFGEEPAKEFVRGFDHTKYSDIEKEINLYYWMGADFCIKTPLESQDRLQSARYAYATFETQRLIEKHGIECVARILDRACKKRINNSRNLVTAVKEVTGEDIKKRLRRYQTFDTREEGLQKYATGFKAAIGREGYGEALFNLLRVRELQGGRSVKNYYTAACVLFEMGHEDAGDQAIKDHLEFLKNRRLDEAHFAMQKLFIEYALKCKNLKKAYETAEEVLKKEPDFVPALAIRMDRLATTDKFSDAKQIARRILELEKNTDSAPYKLAQKLLTPEDKE